MKRFQKFCPLFLSLLLMAAILVPASGLAAPLPDAPHEHHERIETKEATCLEKGWEKHYACDDPTCDQYKVLISEKELPALGHDFSAPAEVLRRPTCTEPGLKRVTCQRCGVKEEQEIPAHGHAWMAMIPFNPPTCTEAGNSEYRVCIFCQRANTVDGEIPVLPPLGHEFGEIAVLTPPTCTAKGRGIHRCNREGCGIVEVVELEMLPHQGEWVVQEEPSWNKPGFEQFICKGCQLVMDEREIPMGAMVYNNSITSFGPCIRDLVGGRVWHRVTPLDLSKDGEFTYPLIASNRFEVGSVTVTIAEGTMTVSYKLNPSQFHVRSEELTFYPHVEALSEGAGMTGFAFDTPIDLAAAFGEDQKVILSVVLKADYHTGGPNVQWFTESAGKISQLTALLDHAAPEAPAAE